MTFRPKDIIDAVTTEQKFLAAYDISQKMTLEQLIELSDDYNVGYDIPENVFEIMVKIPMKTLQSILDKEV